MLLMVTEMMTIKGIFFFSFRFPCALKGGQTWEREGSLFSELPDRVGCAQLEPGAAVAVLSA